LAGSGTAELEPDVKLLKSDDPLDSHPASANAANATATGTEARIRLRIVLTASDLVTVTPP
jgi:hypothetical protein